MESYNLFIEKHKPQLESSGVPELFWKTLYIKLVNTIFDAGSVFQISKIDYDENRLSSFVNKLLISSKNGLFHYDPNNIFLIDHAFTYNLSNVRQYLTNVPKMLDRMSKMMSYSGEEEVKLEFVLKEMWRYNQYFSLNVGSTGDRMSVWYIMDEIGSAINHSNDPTFRTVPFLYLDQQKTYTLLFPVKDVNYCDEVTRDFVENLTNDPEKRRALLFPWEESDFTEESFIQTEPDDACFSFKHVLESLPSDVNVITNGFKSETNKKLKVYSECSVVKRFLTREMFELVDEAKDADILWLVNHFKDYKQLSENFPHVFINQFPFEHVLTINDMLAVICRKKINELDVEMLENDPAWLPITFDLNTELTKFIAYYLHREYYELDNYWICKPSNLARGWDIHVTDNLNHIIRMSTSGSKIAQKYISNPVLYFRSDVGLVKFDIRYVILLKSVKPLQLYAYSNFFLRFDNELFDFDYLMDYQQHSTVMEYNDKSEFYHLQCSDFVNKWDNIYPGFEWKTVIEPKILKMFQQIFEAAVTFPSTRVNAHYPQSRSLYAVDLMVQWKYHNIEPVLLDVNFSPDNQRACDYYPEFYSDVFKLLFLDDDNPARFHHLV